MAIRKDSFSMAMIEQVDITPQRNFEIIPKFGNTIIVLGDARNAAALFPITFANRVFAYPGTGAFAKTMTAH